MTILSLIRKTWEKIQNEGSSPSAFTGENQERSITNTVLDPFLYDFPPETRGRYTIPNFNASNAKTNYERQI